MIVKVVRVRRGKGVIIPESVVKEMGIGAKLEMKFTKDKIILSMPEERKPLGFGELLDEAFSVPDDDKEWRELDAVYSVLGKFGRLARLRNAET